MVGILFIIFNADRALGLQWRATICTGQVKNISSSFTPFLVPRASHL